MRLKFSPKTLLFFEITTVFALLLGVYLNGLDRVPFTPDESQWVHTSYYWEAFTSLNFKSEVWDPQYWTVVGTPMTRYLIGISRNLAGFPAEQLNPPWNFYVDEAANQKLGTIPSSDLLLISRVPMAILAGLSGLLLYLIIKAGFGNWAALWELVIFSISPYFLLHLRRAMSETPMFLPFVMAVFFAWLALRVWIRSDITYKRRQRLALLYLVLTGIAVGFSGAAKINGLATFAATLIICLLMAFSVPNLHRSVRFTFAIRSIALVSLTPLLVLIALNPYLYPDPIRRIVQLVRQRNAEINIQYNQFPESQINTLGERVTVVVQNLFKEYVPFQFPFSEWVYIPLFLLGMGFLVYALWRWVKGIPDNPAAVALLILPLPLIVTMLMTPLNWDRYFLLPVLMADVAIAIGLAKLPLAFLAIRHKIRPAP